jgi:hypothetical protein
MVFVAIGGPPPPPLLGYSTGCVLPERSKIKLMNMHQCNISIIVLEKYTCYFHVVIYSLLVLTPYSFNITFCLSKIVEYINWAYEILKN